MVGRQYVKEGVIKLARSYAESKIGASGVAKLDALMSAAKGQYAAYKSASSPAAVLKGTKLKSYFDKTYEKKCGTEVKQQDLTFTGTALTTTLTSLSTPYTGIGQGLTDALRIGASIEVKACNFDLTFFAGAASASAVLVRVIVVKQSIMQNAALSSAVILQSNTNIRSPRMLDVTRSFTVLKDDTFTLASLTSGASNSLKQWRWKYVPRHCHKITWTQADSTGTINNMDEGNLTIFVMYQGATAPVVDGYIRAEWVDL